MMTFPKLIPVEPSILDCITVEFVYHFGINRKTYFYYLSNEENSFYEGNSILFTGYLFVKRFQIENVKVNIFI